MPHLRNRHLFLSDALLLSVLPFALYSLRFESFTWGPVHTRTAIIYALVGWGIERIVYVVLYRPRGAVSVRQTVVSDHLPQAAVDVTETTTTTRV